MARPFVAALAAVLALALVGCEPETIEVPARDGGQVLLDYAGVLADSDVPERLVRLGDAGVDAVAVTFEAADVTAGDLDRAGEEVVDAWGVDVVVAAAAEPGDFRSTGEDRRRLFGIHAPDRFAVPRGLRERVVEEAVPPYAADNDWPGAFGAAIDELEQALLAAESGAGG